MRKNIGFTLICFSLFTQIVIAQIEEIYFISPGIKLGYTFDAGISYGISLDVGVNNNDYINHGKYGISFDYKFIKVKKYTHRMRSFNLLAQNDFASIKFGVGRVRNPWGYGKRNKCIVHGANIDVSFAYPNSYSPWIGFNYFKYEKAAWAWFMKPYKTLYLNYNYNIMAPIYNSSEKTHPLNNNKE